MISLFTLSLETDPVYQPGKSTNILPHVIFFYYFINSGLLVAYLSLGRMEKKKGKLALFQYYFHRFWR